MKHVRTAVVAVLEYLLGFLALAFFAYLAFGHGPSTDERLLHAFRMAAPLALVELAVLAWRPSPANRLVLGANLWLIAGVLAACLQQWWWLQGYQRRGDVRFAAVVPVIALSWFARLLRRAVRRSA